MLMKVLGRKSISGWNCLACVLFSGTTVIAVFEESAGSEIQESVGTEILESSEFVLLGSGEPEELDGGREEGDADNILDSYR